MHTWIVSALASLISIQAASLPKDVVDVEIKLDAETLEPGQEYTIVFEHDFKDGWSAADAGIPEPILQIQAPDSVRLSGKRLKSRKELSKNEFLRAPYERRLKAARTEIKFTLLSKPGKKDRFRFNLLAYVTDNPEKSSWFLRKRFKLRLAASAEGGVVSSKKSNWGDSDILQLGDKAPKFELPRADASKVSLETYLGKKNIVITTYRAFW